MIFVISCAYDVVAIPISIADVHQTWSSGFAWFAVFRCPALSMVHSHDFLVLFDTTIRNRCCSKAGFAFGARCETDVQSCSGSFYFSSRSAAAGPPNLQYQSLRFEICIAVESVDRPANRLHLRLQPPSERVPVTWHWTGLSWRKDIFIGRMEGRKVRLRKKPVVLSGNPEKAIHTTSFEFRTGTLWRFIFGIPCLYISLGDPAFLSRSSVNWTLRHGPE
ncbi:hypothetical protein C8J56DRAFT_512186 [Mycena floridula]|nr:hypothetical protein C8J56DRAFT_512186 [Mycena floridula]